MLATKDYKSRYRSAALGIAWSVFLPLIQAAVLTVVFSLVLQLDADPYPYPAFVLAGTTAWSYFNQSLTAGSTTIVDQSGIAGKLYFPRMILPAVPAMGNGISLGISVLIATVVSLALGVRPGWHLLALPLAVAVVFLLAFLAAASLTVLHVYSRDVRYLVAAGVPILFYVTPVIYKPELADAHGLRWVLDLNPVTGAVLLFRWCLLGDIPGLGRSLISTIAWIVVLAVVALAVYQRHERTAVDRL